MTHDAQHVLVIIPTYNRAQFLPEAIESVLAQDYPHTRIVIVDDGSTDETGHVCEAYLRGHASRVMYGYQENSGCASARNRGLAFIDESIGYVCFLDSDDRLLPGKLNREVELLRQHPDADFTYADWILHEEASGRELRQRAAAAGKPDEFAIQHFLTNEAKSAAVLYRVSVCRDRRFRENLRYNEDTEFLQRVSIERKGVYAPESSCWVRDHPGAKSWNLIEVRKAEFSTCQEILASYPAFYQSFARLADRRVAKLRRALLAELVFNTRWDEASEVARGAIEKGTVACRLKGYYTFKRCVRGMIERATGRRDPQIP